MKIECGKFSMEDGALYAPVEYMQEQGNARLDEILAGNNTVFNMTAHLSPSVEMAVLVNLQTDYAGWLGMRQFMTALDPPKAPDLDGPAEIISDEDFPARAAQMVENIDAYVAATGQACGFKLFDMMPPCVLIAGHEGIHTDGFGGHYGQYDAAIAEEEREAEDNARAADQD